MEFIILTSDGVTYRHDFKDLADLLVFIEDTTAVVIRNDAVIPMLDYRSNVDLLALENGEKK